MVVAIALDFVGSNVSRRIKSIMLSSKKHHVVGQLVLENRAIMLVSRERVMRGMRRVEKGSRRRGIIVLSYLFDGRFSLRILRVIREGVR